MLRAWLCANDSAQRNIGKFDPWTISTIVDYNHMCLMDHRKEELALKDLLLECENLLPAGNDKTVARAKILFNLGGALGAQRRYDEEEPVALELVAYGRSAGDAIEELRGLMLAAVAQSGLGKNLLAEASLRRSIFLIDTMKSFGRKSPWYAYPFSKMSFLIESAGSASCRMTRDTLVPLFCDPAR